MNWIIAAPYAVDHKSGLWGSISEMDKSFKFIPSSPHYEHDRSRKQSGLKDWQDYWQHSADIWQKATKNQAGIITTFPQLPVCTGLRKKFAKENIPIIAWTFNLGSLHGNIKRILAQYALNQVNKFIVHSSVERTIYSEYLNLPEDRFEFVPLYRAPFPITEQEEQDRPFILSMGSANRDYVTLFQAIKKLALPLTIVAPSHCLVGLEIPSFVTVKSNLSLTECRKLVQQARINIISVDNEKTASGQVTILEAMTYARAVIATDTIGSRDYIVNGSTGILTLPKNVMELESAIDTLWNNDALRKNLAINGHHYVSTELSEKKTSERIMKILQRFH